MTSLANGFRSWILSRASLLTHVVEGCTVESLDDEHVRIATEKATANVNFYELDPGAPEIVELNIVPADDPDNPTFFLHFEMDDLDHANQLFDELTETLSQLTVQRTTRILLSCTTGLTTSFFAQKLAEIAATLLLDYEFEAKPIVQALEVAGEYEVVIYGAAGAHEARRAAQEGLDDGGRPRPRVGLPLVAALPWRLPRKSMWLSTCCPTWTSLRVSSRAGFPKAPSPSWCTCATTTSACWWGSTPSA